MTNNSKTQLMTGESKIRFIYKEKIIEIIRKARIELTGIPEESP